MRIFEVCRMQVRKSLVKSGFERSERSLSSGRSGSSLKVRSGGRFPGLLGGLWGVFEGL